MKHRSWKERRNEENPLYDEALKASCRDLQSAGFRGVEEDTSINSRVVRLYAPLSGADAWYADEMLWALDELETTERYRDLLFNVSLQDTNGRWFAITHAWENLELATNEWRRELVGAMNRYMKQDSPDDSDYAIVAIEVSVYPYRK